MKEKKESTGRSTGTKKQVRARMAETGEKYTTALRAILAEQAARKETK